MRWFCHFSLDFLTSWTPTPYGGHNAPLHLLIASYAIYTKCIGVAGRDAFSITAMWHIDFLMAIEVAIWQYKKRWIIHDWGAFLHLPSPDSVLPAFPKSNLSKGWIVLRFWFRERGAWVWKANFGLWTAFYGNICDILLILHNVLGLFAVGRIRIQESAWLDDWLWWYVEGHVDVVVANKGANNWGWWWKNNVHFKVFCW